MDIEVETLQKNIEALKKEQLELDDQLQFNNAQIQNLNQTNSMLVANRNVKQGSIIAFEEMVKLLIGDPEELESEKKKKE